jgi:ribosomal protein S12 methylthiotransferase accessory factor
MLLSERGQVMLRGKHYELVAPLLDGHRSADEIAQQLEGKLPLAEVYHALGQMEKRGYLAARNGAARPDQIFWLLQDVNPTVAGERLEKTTVSITTFGGLDAAPLSAALRSLQISVSAEGGIAVVVTDDYLRSGLDEYNREALRANRRWLLIKPVGSQIWLGPVFQPGKTACWECLASRLQANRELEMFLQEKTGRAEPVSVPIGDLPATQAIAWNLAATEIARWIARESSRALEGKLLTLDTLSWKTEWHTVVHRPQCPACGEPNPPHQPELTLQSRKKGFTRDGGHRTVSPAETLRRYGHHVSRLTGAVTTLDHFTTAPQDVVNVYWSGHNAARPHKNFEAIRSRLRSQCAGKGASDLQAKAGALCEALERYSGIYRGDEPRTKPCRGRDLGDAAIHPNLVMGYSERQYTDRKAWNAHECPSYGVPELFDEEEAIEWTPVWSLTHRTVRYLPTAFCYYDYPMPRRYCWPCSNGSAAGNTLEEAILQGFFELVERDSVALWWYNRVRRPAVGLDSFS